MIRVTPAAAQRLRTILAEHPGESVVRIAIDGTDASAIAFQITLEAAATATDAVQDADGLTLVLHPDAAARMDGVTLDFTPPHGFRFIHPAADASTIINLSLN